MDERTRAATYGDVRRIAELLEAEHVEYALIGGYALALQGIVRLTEDVDILVEPTPENARRWVRALSRLPDGAAKELAGDETLHAEPYAIRINDEFTVDVMNSASGLSWQDLLPYRTRIDGINVVSLQGLLRMKEHGRLKVSGRCRGHKEGSRLFSRALGRQRSRTGVFLRPRPARLCGE